MNEKDFQHHKIAARIAFFAFVSAVFCGCIGFSLFERSGWCIPLLFIVFLLISLSFSGYRTLFIASSIIGTLFSSGIFLYYTSHFEHTYTTLPEILTDTCIIQKKLSESLFICKTEGFDDIKLSISSWNIISLGDTLQFTGKKQIFSRWDRYKIYSEDISSVYTVSVFEILKKNAEYSLFYIIKHVFGQQITKLFPPREASLLEGMLLWNGENFDNAQKNNYRISGLSHLVVASGSNIILVLTFLLIFLKPVPSSIKIPTLLLGIWGYYILAGMGLPLLRAVCMGTFSIIFFKKSIDRLPLLFSVAFLFVILNPLLLVYSASFQLSFLATLSLILLSDPITSLLKKIHTPNILCEWISPTISATLFTLPITLFSFGNFSPYGILANIFVAPVVPLAIFGWFFSLIIDNLGHGLSTIFGIIPYFSLGYINTIATYIQNLPFSSIQVTNTFIAPIFLAIFFWGILYSIFYKECLKPLPIE